MSELEALIRRQEFFEPLRDEQIALLADCASEASFPPGQLIFKLGAEAEEFYLIRSGLAALELPIEGKGTITIQTVAPGEILGWSWLFPPFQPYFDARAVEQVRAIAFDGKCMRQCCELDNVLGYQLMKLFARVFRERLRAAQLQLIDLYETPVPVL